MEEREYKKERSKWVGFFRRKQTYSLFEPFVETKEKYLHRTEPHKSERGFYNIPYPKWLNQKPSSKSKMSSTTRQITASAHTEADTPPSQAF